MLKNLTIAALFTATSAFALPAMAQTTTETQTIVPGSEAQIDMNESATREGVAAESTVDLNRPENPAAAPSADQIVPGSSAGVRAQEAETRQSVAEGTEANTTTDAATGASADAPLVPGSGATFSESTAVEGQADVLQDQATTPASQN
ncbi:hypothetical protein DYI37_00875 [Fulvimarina endophytica]|uniref:Uncharacterized protein n=1 Tax=Fulvimarina endophytica TaxID=2293836 RepID=A0A371XA14_9HYPH|nr:hypothetical protein [Fulvimarina endophytica]RFC66059.1 hypothetical protein DYI37_00875 [Fulvimarina endophytica]